MSRSKYRPRGKRYDPSDRAEWYAYKRRREDIATGQVRVRIYRGRKATSYKGWSLRRFVAYMEDKKSKRLITELPEYPRTPVDVNGIDSKTYEQWLNAIYDPAPDVDCPFARRRR